MTEDELNLWERHGQRDEAGQRELILFYLPLVDVLAKRIARLTGADWQDLRQDGAIGLIKAIARFDPRHGAQFRSFAKHYVYGAIFESSEITRSMARRQYEIYRKVGRTRDELIQTLQRHPTIEEIAEKVKLTTGQIRNAIDARDIAFPGAMPDAEHMPASRPLEWPRPERTLSLLDALAQLNETEQTIIRLYYWEDQSHEEITQRLGLTISNVIKIRQRAIGKLRKRLK
ncbi:MAG: sigma-70 family RNA polymerase sigma factor [Acidobacteriota bacterium]